MKRGQIFGLISLFMIFLLITLSANAKDICNGPQLIGQNEALIKRPRTVPGIVPGGPGPGFYSRGVG